jgi:DNA-directed RNA polymerase subunit H (RpoH/RPB5)
MVQHKTTGTKTYVKYYVSRKFMPNALENISSQIFEETLSKDDTLILIILDEPNDGMLSQLNHLFKNKGIFVVIHNIKRLQYNILDHELVPSMNILNTVDVERLMKDMNLTSLKQLPEIRRFDPQALAMSMRPGQVGVFARKSVTTLENNYYRICA